MTTTQCWRCGDDYSADYPVCRKCEAYRHYTHISCRCKECKPSVLSGLDDKVRAFAVAGSDITRKGYAADIRRLLPKAFAALSELQAQFGDVNGGTQPRFDNEQMAETAVAAGGVLRLKTINRLCSLAPDDDGEEFVPMTEAELAAMNARFAANPETSF